MMEMKDNLDVEVNLKELLATIVRAGKNILLVALTIAVLFGAVGALDCFVLSEDSEQQYELALKAYEQDKQVLQDALDRANRDADNQRDYNDNSQLMHIDPYNKITTTMVFAISGINLEAVTDPFQITQTPISYITSRIQAQYMALWNGLNLEQIVADTAYSGVANKYLREVIWLTSADGGVLTLSVVGDRAADCEQLAQKLYDALLQRKDIVAKASYEHTLVALNAPTTGSSIDLELEKLQLDNQTKLTTKETAAEKCAKDLSALAVPIRDSGVKGIVGNVIIGGVLGVFLAVIWQVIRYFIKGSVSGAKQLTARYGLIHFGSLMKKNGLWSRLGYRVMGEKLWKNEELACAYIRENSMNHLPEGGAVVIATTLEMLGEELSEELIALMGVKGHKVTIVTDATHNPQALSAITQCSGVVLAERAFISQNVDVKELLKTAKQLDKPVYGFVLL